MSTLQINSPSKNLILSKSYLQKYLKNPVPWTLFLSKLFLKKMFLTYVCRFAKLNFHKVSLCKKIQNKFKQNNFPELLKIIIKCLIWFSHHSILPHKGCLFKMLLCNKLPTCPLCKLIFHPKLLFCQNCTCTCILTFYEQCKIWKINHPT